MSEYAPCPACARHVRHDEAACPFCAATLTPREAMLDDEGNVGLRLSRRALLIAASAGLSGCVPVALYGGPPPRAPDPAAQTLDGGPPTPAAQTPDGGPPTPTAQTPDGGTPTPADAGPAPSPPRAVPVRPRIRAPLPRPLYGSPPKP